MTNPTAHLDEVFRLSPNAYMVLDRELRYVAANEAYLRVTGSKLEQLLGQHVLAAFPNDPDDPNNASAVMLRESFNRVLRTGETDVLAHIPYRVPVSAAEGRSEERFWSATHVPLLDERGQVAFILQHTVEVTDLERLKQANAAMAAQIESGVLHRAMRVQDTNRVLEEERARLMGLFEQAPSLMCFLRGEQHVFEMANNAYQQLIGFRELVGKPVSEAIPEAVEQGFVALLDSVYKTGEPFIGRGVRVNLQRKPGQQLEEVWVDFIYQPIRSAEGRVVGIFVQGHDVTDLKRAEAGLQETQLKLQKLNEELELRVVERTSELAEANRELESFSYSVSHDLRAPLRHIMGFAQLLERRAAPQLDEVSRGHLKTISTAAQEGGKLVDDLLAFSRMGRAEMTLISVNLAELVEETRRELAGECSGRSIVWELRELPTITGDPALLRLVMRNLLANAVKYTRPRAEAAIQVGARIEGDEIHVWVQDNGVGFDMKYVDKLFGVFQRLHTPEEFEGTGIGLANVRRIVNRHGGRVWAEGRVGEGASFHFTLPAREKRA